MYNVSKIYLYLYRFFTKIMKNEVKNNTEKTVPDFKKGYNSFSREIRAEVRGKVCAWLTWSRQTFYNKLNGVYPARDMEIRIIKLVYLDYGVDATGAEVTNANEYIKTL